MYLWSEGRQMLSLLSHSLHLWYWNALLLKALLMAIMSTGDTPTVNPLINVLITLIIYKPPAPYFMVCMSKQAENYKILSWESQISYQ